MSLNGGRLRNSACALLRRHCSELVLLRDPYGLHMLKRFHPVERVPSRKLAHDAPLRLNSSLRSRLLRRRLRLFGFGCRGSSSSPIRRCSHSGVFIVASCFPYQCQRASDPLVDLGGIVDCVTV